MSRLWVVLLLVLVLSGCAERQKFWKEVETDKSAQVPYDYGAGKKPPEE
jgi:hypothetical protein